MFHDASVHPCMTLLASLYVAFPDIEEIEVTEDLEFVLMACDGERVCMHACCVYARVCVRACLTTMLATAGVYTKPLQFLCCVSVCKLSIVQGLMFVIFELTRFMNCSSLIKWDKVDFE